MTDFANLPADITPAQFFDLVAAALANEPAPAGAAPDKLVIHVNGADGGVWNLGFEGGALKIAEGPATAPPLQLTMTSDDLRAFIAGAIRDAIKARAGGRTIDASQLAKLFRITSKTEQVKAYSGDLQIVLEGPGQTYRLTLTFGGTAPKPEAPTTTVTFTLDDFLAILGGELQPQAAFFAGKIRLDGDMNLAMGLMALAVG
jgi:putative sterol carrier protein